MKERWDNLTVREKQTLALGMFVIVLLLVYLFVISPLNNKTDTLRNQIKKNAALLTWMIDTNQKIQQVEKKSRPSPVLAGSLLSVVQKQINGTQLVSTLNQLHQVENDAVELTFQNVDFDYLMKWLIQLVEQHGLTITEMKVNQGTAPGKVAIVVVLTQA